MALNASGPISLGGSTSGQSVNLELGQSATAQISFNDANVRTLTGTTAGTALVMPTNFWGKANATVQLTGQTIDTYAYCTTAIGYYTLKSDGKAYKYASETGEVYIEDWVTPTSEASNYEVYASLSSGTLTSGTTGSWLALSSNRLWSVEDGGLGAQSATIVVTVRRTGTSTNLASATITMSATYICI